MPGTRTVIVIGLPVFLPVVETAPSIWYHELYRTTNELLDQHAYRIAAALNAAGSAAVPVPRDGYGSIRVLLERPVAFFSHRHAAYLAGLGSFGVSNMLLTPAYGPRVRFASVLTAAELPPDPVREKELCTRCMRCIEECPAGALEPGDYPASLTDKRACAERSADLFRRHISHAVAASLSARSVRIGASSRTAIATQFSAPASTSAPTAARERLPPSLWCPLSPDGASGAPASPAGIQTSSRADTQSQPFSRSKAKK